MDTVDPIKPSMESELLNVLIRLMTPFRRQFQQTLDVNRFLVDPGYSGEVVARLLKTDDPRILNAGHFLRERMQIQRPADPVPAQAEDSRFDHIAPAPSVGVPAPTTSELAPTSKPSEDARGAKYVTRLR